MSLILTRFLACRRKDRIVLPKVVLSVDAIPRVSLRYILG